MQPTPPKKPLRASHISKELGVLLGPRKFLFLVGLVLIFLNRGAGLVLPGSTKFLIDDVVLHRRQELLIPIAGAVAAAVLVQAVSSYVLVKVLSTSAQRLIA